jgi:hypothetical protein
MSIEEIIEGAKKLGKELENKPDIDKYMDMKSFWAMIHKLEKEVNNGIYNYPLKD